MTAIERPAEIARARRCVTISNPRLSERAGGAENHAQNLAVRLVELGCNVEVIVRIRMSRRGGRTFGGIARSRVVAAGKGGRGLPAPFWAWFDGGRGPTSCTSTPWGRRCLRRSRPSRCVLLSRTIFRTTRQEVGIQRDRCCGSERAGMLFANARIAVSAVLARRMGKPYRVSVFVIPNGICNP